ncbi:MAG: helix-turn-helix transcriptional regulator [Clostridia bacterium]|nr:helix-turn-helix transcriptional regulator [Clostridia bacterium]
MKDIFANRIKHYRRKEDLTQEELAIKIGISPQSVSKWERGEGFPDVSLLPIIANYFGITIDELLGNDEICKRQAKNNFYHKMGVGMTTEDKFKLSVEYSKKYPRTDCFLSTLITQAMELSDEKRKEYVPIVKETCEKVVAESLNQKTREKAIKCMCMICPDDEFEKWYKMTCTEYQNTSMEIFEERLWKLGKKAESRMYHRVNDFNLLLHYMFRLDRCYDVPKELLDWCIKRVNIIDSFATDGKIPVLWLGAYARFHAHIAAAKFGLGNKEDGYYYLEKSIELFDKWVNDPFFNKVMTFGDNMTSWNGLEINIFRQRFIFNGSREEFCPNLFYLRVWREYLYDFMTVREYDTSTYEWYNGWEHFDSVRNEERYLKCIEKAKSIALGNEQ